MTQICCPTILSTSTQMDEYIIIDLVEFNIEIAEQFHIKNE